MIQGMAQGMGIRTKIGIGFAILIVALTSLISWWGAQTLGLTLELSDLARLDALRQSVLTGWSTQQRALASVAVEVARTLADLDPERDREQTLGVLEELRRHLSLDWVEIVRGDRPLLYPALGLLPLPSSPPAWPRRLFSGQQMENRGFLFGAAPVGRDDLRVVVARRPLPCESSGWAPAPASVPGGPLPGESSGWAPAPASVSWAAGQAGPRSAAVPWLVLWDENGVLEGDAETLSPMELAEYIRSPGTHQRVQKGRLIRLRSGALTPAGPWLLVGYEADAAHLTRTGVNELMLQLAVLQVVGLLVLGYFLGRRLFRPLEHLRDGIEQVAAGHWHELPTDTVGAGGPDEIGAVAESFNRMVRELSAARDRLIEVQQELMRKEKMAVLGRFSAGVAHEINNPLGTILVSAGIAREALQKGAGVEPEEVEAIIEETKRCRHIVDSLLKYAHNKPPQLQTAALGPLVRASVEPLAEQIAKAGIAVEIRPISEVSVQVDALGIGQVFRNLLANARDALEGQANGRIRVGAEMPGDGFVRVTVADNGPGLGEAGEHLFEPLMTTKPQGTGLGLAICQSIVEGHGGRIWAERTGDGWTAFHFTLVCPPVEKAL